MPLRFVSHSHRPGLVFLLGGAVLACGSGGGERSGVPDGFSSCRLPGGLAAWCGTVSVPEDHRAPDGPRIDLRVAMVLPTAEYPSILPVYMLAGGPGQAGTEVLPPVAIRLGRLRRRHPLVFVDQRGTGGSAPMACPAPSTLDERLRPVPDWDRLDACRRTLPLDPAVVTTEQSVADLDAVRRRLGHDIVALVGGSYGTRLALSYVRRHPEHVAAAVLDGVAPPQMVLFEDFAPDAEAALRGRIAQCMEDAACAAAHPHLEQAVRDALVDLPEAPGRRTQVTDPRTGESAEVFVSRDGVGIALRALLYPTELAPVVPHVLERLAAGDPGPILSAALTFSEEVDRRVATGMLLSVVCAEDLPRIDPGRAAAKAAGTFLGDAVYRPMVEACGRWGAAPVPSEHAAPVAATVPTLLLSGALDPVTPPRWADLAARTLEVSKHVVVPQAGHGTLTLGCVPDLVAEFLGEPDRLSRIDVGCAADFASFPFFIDAAGPVP